MPRFSDKTKNDWDDRDNFEKVQGKYDLLKMDYEASTNVGFLEFLLIKFIVSLFYLLKSRLGF